MLIALVCESCLGINKSSRNFYTCPDCKKETCEKCFDRYAFCKECANGRSDQDLELASNEAGYEFDIT